jgi:hypothetical protein
MGKYVTIGNVAYPFAATVKGRQGIWSMGDSYSDLERSSREAAYFERVVRSYLGKEGRELVGYLQEKGYQMIDLEGIGSATLEDKVVAALSRNCNSGVLLSNAGGKGFEERISDLAEHYQVSPETARRYVLDHEMTHAAKISDERKVEAILEGYYLAKAERAENPAEKEEYRQLASIARQRQQEVDKNYQKAA